MKKILIPFVLAAILFGGCKKDDESCTLSQASLVGSYKLSSIKYKTSSSSAETEVIGSYLDACERDDIITFNSNSTYNYVDAGTQCSPPGDDAGTWSVSGNTLIVDGTSLGVTAYECSSFQYTEYGSIINGDVTVFTFVRQ